MESLYSLLMELSSYTHFISFGLLMLAGFNLPISEDIVFIVSAAVAATVVPQNTWYIFTGCFLGAYFSDIVAYAIGRVFGRHILKLKFFSRLVPEKTLLKVESYFHKYGGKTLFFGRFVPFGVRNVVFMSCGIGKMKLKKFLVLDILALSITSTLLFSLGYFFGSNYQSIFPYLKKYRFIIFGIFLAVVLIIAFRKFRGKKQPVGIIQASE